MLFAQSSFDVDQGLELAQVMGVSGAVAHALEGEVGGVIVMDEDAFEVLFDIAASRADAQDGQEWGAQHVEASGYGAAIRRPVSSRCLTGTAVRITSATWARKGSKRLAVRRPMAVIVAVEMDTAKRSLMSSAKALLGNELGVQQVAHPGGDAWPVLDRGGHGVPGRRLLSRWRRRRRGSDGRGVR